MQHVSQCSALQRRSCRTPRVPIPIPPPPLLFSYPTVRNKWPLGPFIPKQEDDEEEEEEDEDDEEEENEEEQEDEEEEEGMEEGEGEEAGVPLVSIPHFFQNVRRLENGPD